MAGKKSADHREDIDFRVLRLVEKRLDISQREIAKELGISLGAVNYCLRALIDKGHIKIAAFRKSRNKTGYIYALTPQGMVHRAHMAIRFIDGKLKEYRNIEYEIEEIKSDINFYQDSAD